MLTVNSESQERGDWPLLHLWGTDKLTVLAEVRGPTSWGRPFPGWDPALHKKRRELSRSKPPSLSDSWYWTQCAQLPQSPAVLVPAMIDCTLNDELKQARSSLQAFVKVLMIHK